MKRSTSAFVTLLGLVFSTSIALCDDKPKIISVKKIWNEGTHNAFTDLIRFKGSWWCTFREAAAHGNGALGKARVIVSKDGAEWKSAALLEEKGVDLRDPKLSITPDGFLMLIMGGSIYEGKVYKTRAPRVAFSKDGSDWTQPKKLLAEDHWLWRVTWHDGWAWSVSKLGEGRDPRRGMLYRSRDGIDWQWITEFRLPNKTWNASETTLRFMPDGELVALTRPHWIGTSKPPYTEWSWTKIPTGLGGPNFIRTPNGKLWASSRNNGTTVLARMTRTTYEPVLTLPSGGDTSYPGMVWYKGQLWLSYYSSHEGQTSIYLAVIEL